jgi:hypothetical protein
MPILQLRQRGAELTQAALIAGQHVHVSFRTSGANDAIAAGGYAHRYFASGSPNVGLEASHSRVWPTQHSGHIQAELEGRVLSFQLTHNSDCSFFETDAAAFWVDAEGNNAELMRCQADPEIWLFGPMLVLALARRGIYCLHASAYQQVSSARVLVGRSGSGKSTVASAIQLSAQTNVDAAPSVRRLCDDITPIRWQDGALQVLPQFPQLKLRQADWDLPQTLPLTSLVQLKRAQQGKAGNAQPMDASARYFALLQHTVATRLFSEADTRAWWQQLPKMAAALAQNSFVLRAQHDAQAPERAMLAALQALPPFSTEF